MISKEMVTDLIMRMDVFMSKDGTDIPTCRALIDSINSIAGSNDLDAIYVNNVDNILIPDITVIPIYQGSFGRWVMDPDNPNTCPFGYTLEIHRRCFTKFTSEELTAAVLHDLLQNMYSDTAKIRFIKAYNKVIANHRPDKILSMFDDMSLSEVTFLAFIEICMRPFRVPVMQYDYVATDDVLRAYGLGDAYESYLKKVLPMSINDPEDVINKELENDYRDVNTIINSCLDRDIRHYYNTIRSAIPLVSFSHLLGSRSNMTSLGFIPRTRAGSTSASRSKVEKEIIVSESYNNPKTELEIRFQVDKIISGMRYAESEAEREVLLHRIKQLSLKLYKMRESLEKERIKRPTDKNIEARLAFCNDTIAELEDLRVQVVKMDIKVKRWSVYVKDTLPEGYDF